jgi:hypothetical protein
MQCLQHKMAPALYATGALASTIYHATIATPPAKFVGFCVQTAISAYSQQQRTQSMSYTKQSIISQVRQHEQDSGRETGFTTPIRNTEEQDEPTYSWDEHTPEIWREDLPRIEFRSTRPIEPECVVDGCEVHPYPAFSCGIRDCLTCRVYYGVPCGVGSPEEPTEQETT